MSYVENSDRLWDFVRSIVADEGLRLYDLERVGSEGLKVTIDKAGDTTESNTASSEGTNTDSGTGEATEARSGVTSGECSKVCRRLMVVFEAEGADYGMNTEPKLEVSSPGVNRALRRSEHFSEAVGQRVKIVHKAERLTGKKVGAKSVIGQLDSFEDEKVTVLDERTKEQIVVPRDEIQKASISFEF